MPKLIATKEDWIELGYRRFAEQGKSGLVVEKLAKELSVNKSSFYWHFKSRDQYLQAIVNYWIHSNTEQIIKLTDSSKSPKSKFNKLIELAFKKDPLLDFIFYLKRYGQTDKSIQKLVENIDQQRISYTQSLLEALGYNAQDAKKKAILFYKYLIGYHEMIRYKKQNKNYVTEVKSELTQFINY